jgi:hypothetical protein
MGLVTWSEKDIKDALRQRNYIGYVAENPSFHINGVMIYELNQSYLDVKMLYSNDPISTNELVDKLISTLRPNGRNKIFVRIQENQANESQILSVLARKGFGTRQEGREIIAEYPPMDQKRKVSSFKTFLGNNPSEKIGH